jgi:hypothetical protein
MGGILWLASYPKSGNTWMRAFIHNLLRDPAEPVPINELTQFTIGDTVKSWYAQAAGRPVTGLSHEDWGRLRPLTHHLFAGASADTVFVKTHMRLGEAFGAPLISMECTAGAIYIVRDPRDVAISAAAHFGTDIDGVIALMENPVAGTPEDDVNAPQYYGTWSAHVESWTARKHRALMHVRYEDMLEKPLQTFTKVTRFLGVPAPKPRIEKAIRFSSFDVLKAQEQKTGFVERSRRADAFFRAGRAGQWRERLTPVQIERIETAQAEVMRRFGYLR